MKCIIFPRFPISEAYFVRSLMGLVLFHVAAKGWISVQCTHKINVIQNRKRKTKPKP